MRLRVDDANAPVAEALANELRLRAKVEPDALPESVAAALGHPVVREKIATGARGISFPGEAEITIQPDAPDREQLAIGHELMELHLQRGLGAWEQLCQRGAAALLVPAIIFLPALLRHQLDLLALHERFPSASLEVLGNRTVDLCDGSAFTVVDPERGYRRARGISPAEISPAEVRALAMLRRGSYALARGDRWLAQAWRSKRRHRRALVVAVRIG